MTTNQNTSTVTLRNVLYEFALAKDIPDAELLDDFARRYPQYACAIADYAIEIFCEAGVSERSIDCASTASVSPAVSRAMSTFQNALYARLAREKSESVMKIAETVESPFTSLDKTAFRALASNLKVNLVFLCKLRDRQIVASTMTAGFLRFIAEKINISCEHIAAYLSDGPPKLADQFYKSDGKPAAVGQQSFADAVHSSGLSEEQQKFLLNL